MTGALAKWRREPTVLARTCVMAAIFFSVGTFDLGTVKPFDIVKITAVLFFGWLAFGLFLADVFTGRARTRRFTMAYFAGGFLAANTIAWIFSTTKWTSLFGWYGRYSGLVTMLILVLIFYTVACVYRDRRDRIPELFVAIAAGTIVLTTYVMIQRLGLDPIKWAQPGKQGSVGQPYFGTMGNANFAGGYIGLTSPWLYYAFLKSKVTWKKALVVAWGLVELAALWFTSARNGIIALGAAVAVLGFLHIRRSSRTIKMLAAAATVAVVVPAILLAFIVVVHPGAKKPPAALRKVDILRSETIRVRGYWWLAGLKMFAHRPITGWGPDGFVTHYQQYLNRDAAGLGDAETADKPHNVFVEHAADTGLLGLIAYLGLLVVAFRRALRRLRDGPPGERLLGNTLIALLAAYAGQAFFSIDVSAIALLGWVLLGAIAAFADPPTAAEDPKPATTRNNKVLAGVAILLACLLAALSNAPLKADHEARTASRVSKDGTIDEVIGHYENAMHWQPFEPEYPGFAGDYLERTAKNETDAISRQGLLERAIDYYTKMDSLQPNYGLWKEVLGNAQAELAAVGGLDFETAEATLRTARKLSPYDWRVAKAQSDLFNKWAVANAGKKEAAPLLCRAYGYAKASVALRRSRGETQLALGGTLARLGHLDEAREPLQRAARHASTKQAANNLLDTVDKLLAGPKSKRPTFVNCSKF